MCSSAIIFYKQGHKYECDNESYLSVTRFIDLFKEEYDEDAWSWYIAIKLYYIGNFIYEKTNEPYISTNLIGKEIPAHYPVQIWNDKKQGQKRKFIVNGKLQKDYLYNFVDKVKYRQELLELKYLVLKKWNDERVKASEGGSAYHDLKERETLFEMFGFIPEVSRAEIEKKVAKDLTCLADGPQPELMIYCHFIKLPDGSKLKINLVGQSDKPIIRTKGKVRYCQIRDYKTNKDGVEDEDTRNRYNFPIGHIPENKFYHYALQLSCYMWMMEQQGYIYDGLYLDYAKIDFDTGEVLREKEIPVPYLKREIEEMIKYHFNKPKQSGRRQIEVKF